MRRRASDRPTVGALLARLRPVRATVLTSLYRPLAADDRRVAFWRRHVVIGIVISEIAAVTVGVYALLTDSPARLHPVVIALVPTVMFGTPMLLLLPLDRILRHHRGAALFYLWSIADTVVITVICRIDGGASSPLATLLFLTLAFMALAYPPAGVVAMGALMTACYLLVICPPHVTLTAVVVAVVMAAFTVTCALSSSNTWEAHEQQQLLLRTQETLASTDPLTGCLNRRAFLDRLQAATQSGRAASVVVCLIDLDGFKAVNDTQGHAAGDAVLVTVGRALADALRETDTVARLGGDEFAVLTHCCDGPDAVGLAGRLREAVAAAGAPCGVTGSVGVTTLQPGDDVHELLGRADTAMYRAKASGGDLVHALTA